MWAYLKMRDALNIFHMIDIAYCKRYGLWLTTWVKPWGQTSQRPGAIEEALSLHTSRHRAREHRGAMFLRGQFENQKEHCRFMENQRPYMSLSI